MTNTGKFSAVAVFTLALVAGVYGGTRSWNGVVYLTDSGRFRDARTPAAIKRELDFSRLDGAELVTATQKRLVTAARTIISEGVVGIELGHFVTRDANGQRQLACDSFYDRLTLRLTAEGIASAGETPTMEIDAPCRTSEKDIASIAPVWIPVTKILESKPANMDLDFFEGVKFKFDNMGPQWPVSWSLRSVRLYSSVDHGREINITTSELREIRPKPFLVNWLRGGRVPTAVEKQ